MTTTVAMHRAPRWWAVAREQVRVVGLLLRGAGLVLLTVSSALVAFSVFQVVSEASSAPSGPHAVTNFTFTPEVSVVMAFLSLIIPLMVWRDEDPLQRGYHWVMPVSRRAHALARVFAGWVWSMVATLALLLSIVLLTVVVERMTGQPQRYHADFHAWEWLVPFTSATICYLFASAAAVGTRRPLIWIFGVIAIYAGSILVLLERGMTEQAISVMTVWGGYLGGRAATWGVINSFDGKFLDPVRWLGASSLWGGTAFLLLALVASRYREGA